MLLAIAQLCIGDIPTGTAFAISNNLAITAFHCIGNRGTRQTTSKPIHLEFDGWVSDAVIEATDAYRDVAVLRLRARLPEDYTPLRLEPFAIRNERFVAKGYPASVPGVVGFSVSGYIIDTDARLADHAPVIQLHCDESQSLPLAGLSGAPVIMGGSDRTVGIIRWNPPDPARRGLAVGNALYASPVQSITDLLSPAQIQVIPGILALGSIRLPKVSEVTPYYVGTSMSAYAGINDPYVPRIADPLITASLVPGSLTAIIGPPKAGKSRTAFEALKAKFPDAVLIVPPLESGSLEKILHEHKQGFERTQALAIFLDELDRYVEMNIINETVVAMLRDGTTPFVMIGTLHPGRFSILKRIAIPCATVDLDSALGATELAAAQHLYPGEDFTTAGIGERLIAGPELWQRYRDDSNPHVAAVVRAAVDWRRSGMTRPVPDGLLKHFYREYLLVDAPSVDPCDELYESAVVEARRPAASKVSMLAGVATQPERSYSALDYIVEREDTAIARFPRPIPLCIFRSALLGASQGEALDMYSRAFRQGLKAAQDMALDRIFDMNQPNYNWQNPVVIAWARMANEPEISHGLMRRMADICRDPEWEHRALYALLAAEMNLERFQEARSVARALFDLALAKRDSFFCSEVGRNMKELGDLVFASEAYMAAIGLSDSAELYYSDDNLQVALESESEEEAKGEVAKDDYENRIQGATKLLEGHAVGINSYRVSLSSILIQRAADLSGHSVDALLGQAIGYASSVIDSRDPRWIPEAMLCLARIYFDQEQEAKAVEYVRHALEAVRNISREWAPRALGAYLEMESLLRGHGRQAMALELLIEAVNATSYHRHLAAEVVGERLYLTGQLVTAEKYFSIRIKSNVTPPSGKMWVMAGVTSEKIGDEKEALRRYSNAANMVNDPLSAALATAWSAEIRRNRGEIFAARQLVDDGIRILPAARSMLRYMDGEDLVRRGMIVEGAEILIALASEGQGEWSIKAGEYLKAMNRAQE